MPLLEPQLSKADHNLHVARIDLCFEKQRFDDGNARIVLRIAQCEKGIRSYQFH